jgi:hypothetical protein
VLEEPKITKRTKKNRGTHLKTDKNLLKNHLVDEEKEKKTGFGGRSPESSCRAISVSERVSIRRRSVAKN